MDTRPFEWSRDCGGDVSPAEAAQDAHRLGITYSQYAEQYEAQWPFDDEPPTDLVDGMVAAMAEEGDDE